MARLTTENRYYVGSNPTVVSNLRKHMTKLTRKKRQKVTSELLSEYQSSIKNFRRAQKQMETATNRLRNACLNMLVSPVSQTIKDEARGNLVNITFLEP